MKMGGMVEAAVRDSARALTDSDVRKSSEQTNVSDRSIFMLSILGREECGGDDTKNQDSFSNARTTIPCTYDESDNCESLARSAS